MGTVWGQVPTPAPLLKETLLTSYCYIVIHALLCGYPLLLHRANLCITCLLALSLSVVLSNIPTEPSLIHTLRVRIVTGHLPGQMVKYTLVKSPDVFLHSLLYAVYSIWSLLHSRDCIFVLDILSEVYFSASI